MFARTTRLLLRPSWPEDAAELHRAIADEGIVRNLARAPWPYTHEEAVRFATMNHDESYPAFLLMLRTDGAPRLIGACGFNAPRSRVASFCASRLATAGSTLGTSGLATGLGSGGFSGGFSTGFLGGLSCFSTISGAFSGGGAGAGLGTGLGCTTGSGGGGGGVTARGAACWGTLDHSSASAVMVVGLLFQFTPQVSAPTSSRCANIAKPMARSLPGCAGGAKSIRSKALGMA